MVHMHVAEKGVIHEMVRIVKKKPDFHVKETILVLTDSWQEASGGPRARYPQNYAGYQELLRAGAVFPQISERSAPVFTPPQTQPLTSYPPNLRIANLQQSQNFRLQDTISMEHLESSSRDGISGFQFQRRGRVFALCILWRILHFGRVCHHWKWLYMDPDSLVSEPRFLELMINIVCQYAQESHNFWGDT
ncbi:VHS domain [Arabidopsis thaliana x Arabidopsis arenosa]|uniref:VHS domain n=1 Tax=Arabidopsis thaliana x Arabidopsis arenosa TaxID=1240361 RepID=A0A8T1YAP6_9BRAS|nr:VHS domain [Arabidopsis thaliana x Arabidopsis arenosa]